MKALTVLPGMMTNTMQNRPRAPCVGFVSRLEADTRSYARLQSKDRLGSASLGLFERSGLCKFFEYVGRHRSSNVIARRRKHENFSKTADFRVLYVGLMSVDKSYQEEMLR